MLGILSSSPLLCRRRILFYSFWLAFFFFQAMPWSRAQISSNPLENFQSPDTITEEYKNQVKENLRIYWGGEYKNIGKGIIGTPFFDKDTLERARIGYDGRIYTQMVANFDIVHDQILIQNFNKNWIILDKEKVSFFSFRGKNFFHLGQDSSQKNKIQEGYYEALFQGKLSVWRKNIKLIGVPSGVGQLDDHFLEYDHFFIEQAGNFYPADNLSLFLSRFPNNIKDFKNFIRERRLKRNRNWKEVLVQLAGHYSTLN